MWVLSILVSQIFTANGYKRGPTRFVGLSAVSETNLYYGCFGLYRFGRIHILPAAKLRLSCWGLIGTIDIFLFIILINFDLIRWLLILTRMLFLLLLGAAVCIGRLRDTWGWNCCPTGPYGPSAITRWRQLILFVHRKIQPSHPFLRSGINPKIWHLLNVLNFASFLDGVRSGGGLVRHSKIPIILFPYRRLGSLPLPIGESIITGSLRILTLSQNGSHIGPLSLHVHFLVAVHGRVGLNQTWAAVVHHAPHAHGDRFRPLLLNLARINRHERLTRKAPFYFKIYCSA